MMHSSLTTGLGGAFGLLAMMFAIGAVIAHRAGVSAPRQGALVAIGHEQIHIVERGREHQGVRPSIVLIHGASVTLRDMDVALGRALSQSFHVIAVDRPGRGYSSRPADGADIKIQARLVREAAMAAGATRPIVVGQSFGGAVALAYGLEFQDELQGLVLLAPVSHKWPGDVAWYNKLSQTSLLGWLFRRAVVPTYGSLIQNRVAASSFHPEQAPENYAKRTGLALLFRPHDFRNNAEDVALLKPQIVEMQSRYAALTLPVRVATGDADKTVNPDLHARQLAADIKSAALTIFPGAGHGLHHTQSKQIIAIIEELANETPAPG